MQADQSLGLGLDISHQPFRGLQQLLLGLLDRCVRLNVPPLGSAHRLQVAARIDDFCFGYEPRQRLGRVRQQNDGRRLGGGRKLRVGRLFEKL